MDGTVLVFMILHTDPEEDPLHVGLIHSAEVTTT